MPSLLRVFASAFVCAVSPFLHATPPIGSSEGGATLAQQDADRAWQRGKDGAFEAAVPFYDLAARVDSKGFAVSARSPFHPEDAPAERHEVRIRTTSFGPLDRPEPWSGTELTVSGDYVQRAASGLTEWYRLAATGVEHGYTVHAGVADARELWIGLEFEGLLPQLYEDGLGARLVDARAQERLRYVGLRAWDANGRAIDARLSVRAAGVGVRLPTAGAAFPITVDPLVSGPAWTFEPNQAGAAANVSVGGDFDGDGFSDLLVAVPGYDVDLGPPSGVQVDAGRAYAFYGSASGLPVPPLTPGRFTILQRGVASEGFATTVRVADLDADGYDEALIGLPSYGTGATTGHDNEGSVQVYKGWPAGLSNSPWFHVDGQGNGLRMGLVRDAGDVNGDGFADVLVQNGGHSVGSATFFRAHLYLGGTTPPTTPYWTLQGTDLTASLGITTCDFTRSLITTAGDVNSDGYGDLLVGCTDDGFYPGCGPGYQRSWAMLLLGTNAPAGPSKTPVWSWSRNALPGRGIDTIEVARLGDVDGNGYADFAVGSWDECFATASSTEGAVYVFLSDPATYPSTIVPTLPSVSVLGTTIGQALGENGQARYAAGDLNGDGFADAVFGEALNGVGRLRLLRGTSTGPSLAADLVDPPSYALGLEFGMSATGCGDVNGDGLSDVSTGTFLYGSAGEAQEGLVLVYHGNPLPSALLTPLAGQTATLSGNGGDAFATALTTAGDVNGDGFSDLLVGSPGFQGSFASEGRVLLYRAKNDGTGLENTSVWSFAGGQVDARLGTSVSFAGDVNNDGFTDVLVGAPGYANPPTQFQEGKAYLFLGTASGVLSNTPSWTYEGDATNAKFGQSVAGAGDVDGDGFSDVFVGAPGATVSGVQDAGRVYVFLGSPLGLSATPALILDNPVLGDSRFGACVANAGDLNRDGQTDLVVGAPDYTNGQSEEGRFYVYVGSTAGILPAPAFSFESDAVGAHLGHAVSAAGDVDSDGFADLLVGSPDHPGGGRVTLFRGQSGLQPIATGSQVFAGTQGGARLGAALCRAGDVNNDGFSDAVFAAPNHNVDQGEVYVHFGVSTGLAPSPALTFAGAGGAHLGAGLGGCGDIDGDGYSDVVLGVPGQLSGAGGAVIYVGSTQYGGVHRTQQRRTTSADAIDLLCLTDSTSGLRLLGGANNFANVQSTPAGRSRVALEWEMKSGAALLDGSNLANGAYQDVGAPNASLTLVETVPGLNPSERHQWRQRIATRDPLFPHGPWSALQGNGKHEKKFGTGFDCDQDGTPDSIEIAQNPTLDCDANGALDACQITVDPTLDCDGDGALNECELFTNDCDANNYPDDCQVAQGAPDCNANNTLDACELSPATDVNGDSILDVCQFTPYCFGDGTGTACPCGNFGAAGRGCANSVNANGAVLTVTGWPSIANDTLVLHGAGMPNSASPSAIYLQGTLQDNGGAGSVIQDGLRCVTGVIVRLGTRPNAGNQSQYPDVGNQVISIRGGLAPLPMPQTRHYQVFYRNAATAFCPPGTANWTNGLSIVWGP
ncbi:MAG: FG-GAP repeat protein [Planctomycetes bacterium]|nr:FG-GAP repeat protein [Planctomycetota bacterium]